MAPAVSVLLPVYNAGIHLQAALASLESDLDGNVEVIAVDDGSTDGSGEALDRWQTRNVCVIHQDNAGLVGALTTAVAAASAPLLARMDADDVNLPGRIPAALAVLQDAPDVALVSPWAQQIGPDGSPRDLWRYPWGDSAVARSLYVDNPIIHGAAVFRRAAYDAAGGYQPSQAEDLDLWDRMTCHGSVRLIPQVLFQYRVGVDSQTTRNATAQAAAAEAIKRRRWDRQPPSVTRLTRDVWRYRQSGSRDTHRSHLRDLARIAKAHGDRMRFAAFAAAYAAS